MKMSLSKTFISKAAILPMVFVTATGNISANEYGGHHHQPSTPSTTETRVDVGAGALATGGAAEATGGAATATGGAIKGNQFNNNNSFKGGAMPGAPFLGGMYLPNECMDGLQLTLFGGAPSAGGGGVGFTFIDPAGVYLKDGMSVFEFANLKLNERNQHMDHLPKGDKERLNCLTTVIHAQERAFKHALEMSEQQHGHEARMQTAKFRHEMHMLMWKTSAEAFLKSVKHACGGNLYRPRRQEHQDMCGEVFEKGMNQFMRGKDFMENYDGGANIFGEDMLYPAGPSEEDLKKEIVITPTNKPDARHTPLPVEP